MTSTFDRPLRLIVITAGTSVPSSTRMLADTMARATVGELDRLGLQAEASVLDLRELAHEVVDATFSRFPGDALRDALRALSEADGVIAVTPTYNQSYSGLFKALIDVIEPGTLTGVPVALGATGGSARHSLVIDYALRPLFAYLKADVVPTAIYAASEDFGAPAQDRSQDSLRTRANRTATELAEYMRRFADHTGTSITPTRADSGRGRLGPENEFTDFTPMSELLHR